MAKKEITKLVKLQIAAGSASPSPPVGPALGQAGVNIMEFCKAFNDRTKDLEKGAPIPVVITVYKDKSFDFITKLPSVSFLIKKAAGVKSGSKTPGKGASAGKVKRSELRKVAELKMPDMNTTDVEAALRMLEGSARSMFIEVVEG